MAQSTKLCRRSNVRVSSVFDPFHRKMQPARMNRPACIEPAVHAWPRLAILIGGEALALRAKTPTRDARIRERCVFEEAITGLLSREEARHAFIQGREHLRSEQSALDDPAPEQRGVFLVGVRIKADMAKGVSNEKLLKEH